MEANLADPPAIDASLVRTFAAWLPPGRLDGWQPTGPSAVYTPWVVTWLMVHQRLRAGGTLQQAVGDLHGIPEDLLPDCRRIREETVSAATGGYSRARKKLGLAVVERAADEAFASRVADAPPAWRGRRVFILDGTTLSLPTAPNLKRPFPPASNQHGQSPWHLAHLVAAHELGGTAAARPEVGPKYGPDAVGEVALALRLLERVPRDSVVLADRNFGVFGCVRGAKAAGFEVVSRLTRVRFDALRRKADPAGPGLWTLDWKPTRHDRPGFPGLPPDACVSVRLHEIQVSPEVALLLVATFEAPEAALAGLYRRRGDIETDIRDYKRTLDMESLRGRSEDIVLKEIAAAAIAYNLTLTIRRIAARRAKVDPRRLSFARVFQLVDTMLLGVPVADPADAERRLERLVRLAAQCKLPIRPGRKYPRTVIPRRRKFPNRTKATVGK